MQLNSVSPSYTVLIVAGAAMALGFSIAVANASNNEELPEVLPAEELPTAE